MKNINKIFIVLDSILKYIKSKIFNKINIFTMVITAFIIFLMRLFFNIYGIDVHLSYLFIVFCRLIRDIIRAIIEDIYTENSNLNILKKESKEISSKYQMNINKKLNNGRLKR